MHSIAMTNQKGGVGKTTTTANLGAALSLAGKRVCMLDLDPQAHLTMHLGLEPGKAKPGVYELLGGSANLEECVQTVRPNMDLVPAEINLAGAEVELVGVVGREILLRDALDPARDRYDVVLIDCPPSLGLLTINALSAVEEVFIALQPHFLAMQGLGKLLETVSLVQRRINSQLGVSGVVLCMYDSRTALCGEVAMEVKRFFKSEHPLKSLWQGAHIFNTYIRRNIRLAEAPGHGKTIFEYAHDSHGAQDYHALAQELLGFWRGEVTKEQPLAPEPEAMTDGAVQQNEPAGTIVPVEAGPATAQTPEPIVPSEPSEAQAVADGAEPQPSQEGVELSVESVSTPVPEAVNPIGPSECPDPFESYETTADENSTQHGAG